MKQDDDNDTIFTIEVTPIAGVWVETWPRYSGHIIVGVTPIAGVWVETAVRLHNPGAGHVTPIAGVWVETSRLAPE